MSEKISRDPWAMKNYAKSFNKSVDTIRDELLNTSRTVKEHVESLDPKSQEAAGYFDEYVTKINSQLDEYNNLAKMLDKNADNLIEVLNKAKF